MVKVEIRKVLSSLQQRGQKAFLSQLSSLLGFIHSIGVGIFSTCKKYHNKRETNVYCHCLSQDTTAQRQVRGGIFKLLRSPGIDSKESILPALVDRRACTTTQLLLGSSPTYMYCSKIPAQTALRLRGSDPFLWTIHLSVNFVYASSYRKSKAS
jgi:hypothetical protein